jgi:hypothetical protein
VKLMHYGAEKRLQRCCRSACGFCVLCRRHSHMRVRQRCSKCTCSFDRAWMPSKADKAATCRKWEECICICYMLANPKGQWP